jgi:hypothetical protein
MHSIVERIGSEPIKLQKRASKDPRRLIRFHVTLKELRQVADDMGNTFHYIWGVLVAWHSRHPAKEGLFAGRFWPPGMPETP